MKSEVYGDLLRFVGFGFGSGRMILSFFLATEELS